MGIFIDKEFSTVESKMVLQHKHEWLIKKDTLFGLFPGELIHDALSFIDWEDLVMQERVYTKPNTPFVLLEITKETSYKIINGVHTPLTTDVYHLIVPSKYQGSVNSFIIRYCLHRLLPGFTKFEWNIYGTLSSDPKEIYMKTSKGSLYVPIQALLDKKWKDIKDRHTFYFTRYYKDFVRVDNKEELKQKLEILETPEAKALKTLLS